MRLIAALRDRLGSAAETATGRSTAVPLLQHVQGGETHAPPGVCGELGGIVAAKTNVSERTDPLARARPRRAQL